MGREGPKKRQKSGHEKTPTVSREGLLLKLREEIASLFSDGS